MNRISPTELTRDIAKSAAVQMAEYNYAEAMKNCGGDPDNATQNMPAGGGLRGKYQASAVRWK